MRTSADSVWRACAGDETLAALSPGIPHHVPRRPDVLVVGGGMVGLATAASCVRAGVGEVVVLERDELASGASGGAAAILAPDSHALTDPPAFVGLARTSFRHWRLLDQEWDGALGVEPLESLAPLPVALPPGTDLGPAVDIVDGDTARALEPELSDYPGALVFHGQGRINPLRAAAAFASRGGSVATGIEVVGTNVDVDRVQVVHTTHGDFQPGAVIFATGLAPPMLNLEVRQEWVKGHLIATEPAPFRLRMGLATLECGVLQLPGGELLAGGTLDEGDLGEGVRAEVVEKVRAALGALVPRAHDLPIRHAWCCFRPATADRQPVIDRVPGFENAWVTCGQFRTGILMAAGTGDALARWIGSGERPPEVAAFGIDRPGREPDHAPT